MYTFNNNYGIGQVQGIENQMVTIYFEDSDITKKVPFGFVKIYANENDLENEINQILSNDQLEEILLADKKRHEDRMENQSLISYINEQTSYNCAKSI
jgi:hypothetical protein